MTVGIGVAYIITYLIMPIITLGGDIIILPKALLIVMVIVLLLMK